jgi:hypothetical protein
MGQTEVCPRWYLILQAANFDPLRAQEIEEGVSRRWWEYYMTWLKASGEAALHMNKSK